MGDENGKELMLCIMPDEFETSFQVYADWKRKTGIDIHITTFTDISANSGNPDIIKNHISDAYHNWEYPPTFVLIIGDEGIFPHRIVTYPDYSFPHEDYFVEVDGNDFFPDIMIGRFTNQGDYRMQVMINKYQRYEQFPYVPASNPNWFKTGLCCSNNAYESQVETKRFAASVMEIDGGFTVDTLMSDGSGFGGCSMNLNDVTTKLESGVGFLNYRGEGWSDGWHANCYYFDASDVSGLNNGEMFTFVTSIGCGVAMFTSGSGNCFGESWIQLGSISSPRGAVGFIGPTSNTHTTYNNRIDKGIYQGMFREGMDHPGQALLRGKLYMYNVFGSDPWVEYHYNVYCVLGDPSLHIWKEVPLAVNVAHTSTMNIGYNQCEATVAYAGTGAPAANAQVTLTNDEIFATVYTDSLGKMLLGVIPTTTDTINITVRGKDIIPYEGYIVVTQANEHVGPDDVPAVVDIDGNMNGIINPNENITLAFELKNWGTQTANNVQATVSTTDTNITVVSTTPVDFYNLSSGSTYTGAPFQVFVKPTCPLGHVFTIDLNITSTTGSWSYQYADEVLGCYLVYTDVVVNDDLATIPNYRMDPGETVKVFVTVRNDGQDFAPSVMGILSSDDMYISVPDSVGTFGSLSIGSWITNENDYFEVTVDAACPAGHNPEFNLLLYTQNATYPYEVMKTLTIPVSLPMSHDYTGPDNYGYYAYTNDDVLFEQAPVFDWVEINAVGTEINMTASDFTTSVNLPFTFKYYGSTYNDLRISSDGWIAFGSGTETHFENTALPAADVVNCMVAAFWDDLHSGNWENGELFYYHDVANHQFIIEWDSISHYGDNMDPKSEIFQILLKDPAYHISPTGDGDIIMQYKRVVDRASATVGIEDYNETDGINYVYNNSYDLTASVLQSGLAIRFTTEPPHVTLGTTGLVSDGYALLQNHPNPFSDNTNIDYTIPEDCNLNLRVYDISGQLVRVLETGTKPAGQHRVVWDGKNETGQKMSSGIYFYRLQTPGFVDTKKLYMLR